MITMARIIYMNFTEVNLLINGLAYFRFSTFNLKRTWYFLFRFEKILCYYKIYGLKTLTHLTKKGVQYLRLLNALAILSFSLINSFPFKRIECKYLFR